jgi:hypothetical protein
MSSAHNSTPISGVIQGIPPPGRGAEAAPRVDLAAAVRASGATPFDWLEVAPRPDVSIAVTVKV